jgi:hypothetical protein
MSGGLEMLLLAKLLSPVVQGVLEAILQKVDSPIKESPTGLRLQNIDRRLSVGLAREDDKLVAALLVEKEDSTAQESARKLKESYPGGIVIRVTGKAYSSKPEDVMAQEPVQKLVPGSSIGHYRGFPGSLGGIVTVKTKSRPWLGLISASHVLAINNTADKGDPILQPGSPDGPRVLDNKIGILTNYTYLVHYQDKEGNTDPMNTEDVALVKPSDEERLPAANMVPNPKDPKGKIKLKECIPAEQLFEVVGEEVYKIGRTTGLTSGILDIIGTLSYPIQLPDGRVYAYKDLAVVKNVGKDKFSQPGDSGSIAYTADGRAIGLVVGGSPDYTFLSPLSSCLKAMKAELLV